MKGALFCAVALMLVLVASAGAYADWGMTPLYNADHSQSVELTPSYSLSGSTYTYMYSLKNTTSSKTIQEFILTLPGAVSVSGFANIAGPTGWSALVRPTFNQLDWFKDTGSSLLPGQTFTFSFTSSYGPSSTAVAGAACQDAIGLSGQTFSPIPEPASLIAMMTGLVGLVGLKMRRK